MSRSRITTLVLCLACPVIGLAQREAAIDSFLKPIIRNIATDPNVGGWEWKTNRNGGYLLRRELDVTGDNHPEIFIATTLTSGRRSHRWAVYDMKEDGTLQPYHKELSFRSGVTFKENGLTYLLTDILHDDERMKVSDSKPYRATNYFFNFPNISETTTYLSEQESIKIQSSGTNESSKLQAILLADYLTEPDAKWSTVPELKLDINDCYYLDKDKDRATNNTIFTPSVALSHLTSSQSDQPDKGKQSSQSQTELDTAAINVKNAKSIAKNGHSPSDLPARSQQLWIMVILSVLAIIASFYFMFKKRSR